jgi:predicted amino acid-binding ACT domain protein
MNTRSPHAYVLNVLSDDHPGIVASVGTTIQQLDGNIDSCSQTVLEG